MKFLNDLLSNFPLICAGTAWLTAQILKVFCGIFRLRSFNIVDLLFGTGGMPSSHTAAVISMAVAVALSEGLASPVFAVCFLFAMIVIRDATGVRREAGEQAKVLNRVVREVFRPEDGADINRDLKELVGHTPFQVFVGALVGAAIPFLMALIPAYRWVLFG